MANEVVLLNEGEANPTAFPVVASYSVASFDVTAACVVSCGFHPAHIVLYDMDGVVMWFYTSACDPIYPETETTLDGIPPSTMPGYAKGSGRFLVLHSGGADIGETALGRIFNFLKPGDLDADGNVVTVKGFEIKAINTGGYGLTNGNDHVIEVWR